MELSRQKRGRKDITKDEEILRGQKRREAEDLEVISRGSWLAVIETERKSLFHTSFTIAHSTLLIYAVFIVEYY